MSHFFYYGEGLEINLQWFAVPVNFLFSPYSHQLPPLLALSALWLSNTEQISPSGKVKKPIFIWGAEEGKNEKYEASEARTGAYGKRINPVWTRSLELSGSFRSKQGCMQILASAGSPIPWQWDWVSQTNHHTYLRLKDLGFIHTLYTSWLILLWLTLHTFARIVYQHKREVPTVKLGSWPA